ncbi:RusA family crossover junction endodeoxyribonuclease [Thermus sp. NEB1569]|uniref:RusA family crossover junction endodeoxyribonuclease n=1 Tax=Thermus sp. NEB1569 TaxID=2918899 RepID=UPI001EFB3BE3|nr:RusA family crossover junction endodeoxyribonuclease [Thermus sp. NEB1569]ULR41384.1 RusA family crossover junction endodeoxyribonuclease [Thermus sp. NEB1569]
MRATLPWPPSVNHYWAARDNARYLSPRARAWRDEAAWRLREARNGKGRISQEVALFLFAYPPDRRKRDLDNILKAVLDALVHGGVLKDDHQVAEIHLIRRRPEPGGRVELYLEVMDP